MRKILFLFASALLLTGCGNDSKATESNSSDAIDKAIELSSEKDEPQQKSTIELSETTIHTDSDGYFDKVHIIV
ncbi:lipoprotein [Bavariicoccus seileri]|uniref:lipoprotein n=1 Tax=Bavariicoccus seileri TaxID=549685 RepID=UPI003F938C5C